MGLTLLRLSQSQCLEKLSMQSIARCIYFGSISDNAINPIILWSLLINFHCFSKRLLELQ